ncbi:hypothetical protein N781_08920 [Pontibacillus halophilus JSM 076056 = DSM 19796]|uniref:DUF4145 domain-containing protein n=1 Tax=Pontibacillus halophilus JSM 076056 = DSM 19796 TaxID=1385510 RepID=A0A0A5GCR8_9BACI|nr:DNA phosphorothioation-dependent restriction protein DptF [Pontibacillus halophilus]KGX89829.1 hypothetical protein N781_08920 [Pontibacillus halophilus JSM 076056 = DSM 19796]
MSDYLFDFLEGVETSLADLARKMENLVYEYPSEAIMNARLFTEELAKQIIRNEEDLSYLLHRRQVERIDGLDKSGVLRKDVAKAFDTVRSIGNKSVHQIQNGNIEDALRVHRNMFKLSIWFMEVYGDYNFTAPDYRPPSIRKKEEETITKDDINNMIRETLTTHLKKNVNGVSPGTEGVSEQEDNKEKIAVDDGYEPTIFGGSALIYELSKLRESSQEAVENANAFSEFKEYMHVSRPIQEDLVESLEEAAGKSGSQLVLLCGSVGDGKSHMLAYLNKHRPDLMQQFSIHNDATESFDPSKDSMDTLNEVLQSFSDNQLEKSEEKLILAINLGVLHNFLETDYASDSYTKLGDYITESNVFDRTLITNQDDSESFQLISFSDYHAYELTEFGPESSYFTGLLKRITNPVEDNPFYRAYKYDLENSYKGTVLTNYLLLQKEEVRERVVDTLIATVIQQKVIISTRAMLNFIHDILVPTKYMEEQFPSFIEEVEGLLPNLLFGHSERSSILSKLSYMDPIHTRNEKLDGIIIELNNSMNIEKVFSKHINLDGLESFTEGLKELGSFYELTQSTRHLMNTSMIRLAFFLSEELGEVFANHVYDKFGKHLFQYNQGLPRGLRQLYAEVKEAVFKWRGSPKKGHLYTSDSVQSIKTAIELSMTPDVTGLVQRDEAVHYRFKDSLLVTYKDTSTNNIASLEIDYPLYERILKVLDGYKPDKKDKEDAIQFVEFIERLMHLNQNQENVLIYETSHQMLFNLEYDPIFDEYIFKRD